MSCKRQDGKVWPLQSGEEGFHVLLQKAQGERGERVSSSTHSPTVGCEVTGGMKPGQTSSTAKLREADEKPSNFI